MDNRFLKGRTSEIIRITVSFEFAARDGIILTRSSDERAGHRSSRRLYNGDRPTRAELLRGCVESADQNTYAGDENPRQLFSIENAHILPILLIGIPLILQFDKTIVTSNFDRIALRCENPSLYSSKNWLPKTKFDLFKLDE